MSYEIVFISGGVRSGKSSFAEEYALEKATQLNAPLFYIATSSYSDGEMNERIIMHQKQRELSPLQWETIEIDQNFAERVAEIEIKGIVLLDCLTVLLANEMFAKNIKEETLQKESKAISNGLLRGLNNIQKRVKTLIIVSNEVHYECFKDPLIQTYQKTLADLHIEIVKQSTASYLVESGIPIRMK